MRILLLLSLALACRPVVNKETGSTDETPPPPTYPLDDTLTFSDVQAKGTHNSYHLEPGTVFHPSHRYSHAPLDVQLQSQGVRQFELDIHLHKDLGFQVFHIPGVDPDSTCLQFSDCMTTVKNWSDGHPDHMPIMVWLELKDDIDGLVPDLQSLEGKIGDLEQAVLDVWPRERVVTPDEVRAGYSSLTEAVTTVGWPTIGEMRGRVVFSLLESGAHRDAYLDGSPSLEARLFFVDADEDTDLHAAVFKINDAAANSERVAGLVSRGFVVTCNTDSADGSDENNASKRAASLASGVNFLSSDRPAKVAGTDDWFDLPDGTPARCNPVHAPEVCTSADIE
jgi:hypothetical protein